jgi:LuxR family transcriptional regulator, maltose regulon positive regulatory protein
MIKLVRKTHAHAAGSARRAARKRGRRPSGAAAGRACQLWLDAARVVLLILPFAMTGAWELLAALPSHGTAHARSSPTSSTPSTASSPARPSLPNRPTTSAQRVARAALPADQPHRPEIAGQLSVSLNTVNTHIRRIYTKLGATDRSSAVQRGRELRLLPAGRA